MNNLHFHIGKNQTLSFTYSSTTSFISPYSFPFKTHYFKYINRILYVIHLVKVNSK